MNRTGRNRNVGLSNVWSCLPSRIWGLAFPKSARVDWELEYRFSVHASAWFYVLVSCADATRELEGGVAQEATALTPALCCWCVFPNAAVRLVHPVGQLLYE